jgi:hypothetical protein
MRAACTTHLILNLLTLIFGEVYELWKSSLLCISLHRNVIVIEMHHSSSGNVLRIKRVPYTKAVRKVRGLILLLRVGTLWRCGEGLLFEVPSLASDVLLTTLHPLLENVLQTVDHFEMSCLGAPFSWLEAQKSYGTRSDLNSVSGLEKWKGGTPLEHLLHSPRLAPCDFWGLPTMKRELRSKKFRSNQRSAARFREVDGAL